MVRPGRKRGRTDSQAPGVGGLRRAWRHFRQYRAVVARAAADDD
jgi:hypothetical protein